MFSPTPKYAGLPDPIDGVPMNWTAHPDGYPIRRGDAPDLMSRQQLDRAGVKIFARSKCLTIPDEIAEYEEIIDWVANQSGVRPIEKIREIEGGKWIVWLTWYDLRGFVPKDKTPGPAGR